MSASVEKPSRELLDQLKAQHIAFLRQRLTSDAARDEWKANVPKVVPALLDLKIADVLDADALIVAVDASLTSEVLKKTVQPIVRDAQRRAIEELRADKGVVGRFVPAEARTKIDKLLSQKGLIPEKLLRELIEHDALEEVMRDVLFDALKQFSENVNPVFAEWGLPALLKKVIPLGASAVMKSLESARADWDKRLEPEIRKFLLGFSRMSLRRASDFTVSKIDEPKFVALRQRIVAWVLEQSVRDLMANVDASSTELFHEIGYLCSAHAITLDELRKKRHEVIRAFVNEHKDRTLREALSSIGAELVIDHDALANATWPMVKGALGAPPVQAWLETLVAEFYDSVESA
ncbi:MAG: hypothetical protein U0165_04330 [Polyangiaceae bacterium]